MRLLKVIGWDASLPQSGDRIGDFRDFRRTEGLDAGIGIGDFVVGGYEPGRF